MNEKKKNPRWLTFLQGAFLWAVTGVFAYGLLTVRGLRPGDILTEQHMAYIGLTEAIVGILAILGFICGLYQLYEALMKESDN